MRGVVGMVPGDWGLGVWDGAARLMGSALFRVLLATVAARIIHANG